MDHEFVKLSSANCVNRLFILRHDVWLFQLYQSATTDKISQVRYVMTVPIFSRCSASLKEMPSRKKGRRVLRDI